MRGASLCGLMRRSINQRYRVPRWMVSRDIGYRAGHVGTSLSTRIHQPPVAGKSRTPHVPTVRNLVHDRLSPNTHSRWFIVVADAAAPDWMVSEDTDAQSTPVQYCGLGEPTTMLQKALHRVRRPRMP